jgi:hypothetical protein
VLHLLREAAWDPIQLFMEPTLLVYNSYLSLIYGLFYLWFENFPVIFVQVSPYFENSSQADRVDTRLLAAPIGALVLGCSYRLARGSLRLPVGQVNTKVQLDR